MNNLYDSLQRRLRPEDVAHIILELNVLFPNTNEERELKNSLERIAKHSLSRGVFKMTSMMQDFFRPVSLDRQTNKANELFESAYNVDCTNVDEVLELIRHISKEIKKNFGKSDFLNDRLNRKSRKRKGLDISKRRYNKLFRFLGRFEEKVKRYSIEVRKYNATRIAKSSLAFRIPKKDFFVSIAAACFVAYFTARSNRRSVFTNKSQDRPFDKCSKMLLDRFKRNPRRAGWRIISYVMPDIEIVSKLTEKEKMNLLTIWLEILNDISDLLKKTWESNKFNRSTMIVKKGDDSSTWNSLAGAWNSARRSWISLMHALGMEDTIKKLCFGKVMRLMAADVAYWHRSSGGELEPDTLVWTELPLPWEVFSGRRSCSQSTVERICKKHNVDPIKKSWTFPVQKRNVVPFKLTPELVHGVVVSHPELANILRKAGWFSGKSARLVDVDLTVERDKHGCATKAK